MERLSRKDLKTWNKKEVLQIIRDRNETFKYPVRRDEAGKYSIDEPQE